MLVSPFRHPSLGRRGVARATVRRARRAARLGLAAGLAGLMNGTMLAGAAQAQAFAPGPGETQNANIPLGSPLQPASAGPQDSLGAQRTPTADLSSAQGTSGVKPVEIQQTSRLRDPAPTDADQLPDRSAKLPAAPPSEFELYTSRVLGRVLPRFGADLLVPGTRDFATPATATVPPSYLLNPGDEVSIDMLGSIDGHLQLTIDTDGRVFIPRVGQVTLVGVRFGDLHDVIARAIGGQFRNFQVTVGIVKLRGIHVYVTGYANNPGAYSLSSLSTLVNATLAAGGPAPGGSFRSIQLYRDGKLISNFDLYDFVRGGDKSGDAVLQNEDVLFIPAVGPQIAIAGSVNAEAIYEAKPKETLADLLTLAGGLNVLADADRVMLYSVENLDKFGGQELPIAAVRTTPAKGGDIVQVLSIGDLARPLERQAVLVKLEGEIARPGNYYVAPNTSLADVLQRAGGLTPRAFSYGTELTRVSVRQQQAKGFADALEQLDLSLAAAPLRGPAIGQDTATLQIQLAAARATVEQVRRAQPTGRVILDIAPDASTPPGDIVLENNDRIYVPPRPTTIGVFGAVYRPGSFQIGVPRTVGDYVVRAGGAIREADKGRIFVVHASGEVVARNRGALKMRVLPGDIVFVPVKTRSGSVLPAIRDIGTTLLGFGLTGAAIHDLAN